MTLLTVWSDTDPDTVLLRTEDPAEVGATLAPLGVRYDRWALADLPAEPSSAEVLAAYEGPVREVAERHGYAFIDTVTMVPGAPAEQVAAARTKFLAEHTHDDDEDRFFARGSGVFYLHLAGRVHAVLCEAGDLLSVPAGTTHWFDMGTRPDYVAVRFFHDDDGWVGNFTGSDIATHYPTYDQLAAARATAG
jgi:1,2-dihydroxy-3-keto-5-methylthiopentene dioxygenase